MDDVASDSDLRTALRHLTMLEDGDEYIVGRPDLGIYVAIPQPGAVLIEALRDGASLGIATARASKAAGAEIDATDFFTGLGDAGLLHDPDHAGPTAAGTRVRWVERLPQAAVKPLFGRIAWAFYAAAAVTLVVLLVVRPDLRPIFDDIWFLADPIWSILALIAVSIVLTAGHECWHWLAGRAVGVPARFRVSWRGVFVVFETDLNDLVTLPRRARYSPMLAGFAFDSVVLAAALLMRLGFREEIIHDPPAFDRFLGAVVFRQIFVLVWQLFGVAFRSDMYAVLANALGCHNLYRATALTGKYRLSRLSASESAELAGMSARDRSVAKWFWLAYLVGGFAMLWFFVTYLAPFVFGMSQWVGPNITSLAIDTVVFWQSLALVVVLVAQYGVIPIIASHERRHRRDAAPTPPTVARDSATVRSRYRLAWGAMLTAIAIVTAYNLSAQVQGYGALLFDQANAADATEANVIAAAHDDACLPGQRVPIMDFPHISQVAEEHVVYNSNPATSGPHYGASVAPGIYSIHLTNGQTVHSMEHGRVVINYRPDTPRDVVLRLESIAKRYTRDTVLQPNPDIDAQFALTAWGRIEKMDSFNEARVVRFIDLLRGRYDHEWPAAVDECKAEQLH